MVEDLKDLEITRVELEEWFEDILPSQFSLDPILSLLWFAIGERDSVLILGASKKDQKVLEDFCGVFGGEIYVDCGDKRGFLDRVLGRDSRVFKDEVFIARDEESFEVLERSGDSFTAESIGEFLEYPESAVEAYSDGSGDPPAMDLNEGVKNLVKDGELDFNELKYLSLLDFVPARDIDDIMEAIELGKERKKLLNELDEEFDTDVGISIWKNCLEEQESTEWLV